MRRHRLYSLINMLLCAALLLGATPTGIRLPSTGVGLPARSPGDDPCGTILLQSVSCPKVTTAQTPTYPLTNQEAAWDTLKTTLKEQMVPQAVTELLELFPNTFGYLSGSSIGMGLNMYNSEYSTDLASVQMRFAHTDDTPPAVDLSYSLRVNVAYLAFDDTNNYALTDASRLNLESTIAHEMMHAMMQESLTSGMAGMDVNMQYGEAFPKWFVEGTAQAVGGGVGYVERALRIYATSTREEIQTVLGGSHKLGSDTTYSNYCTGYLAALYLGYLAGGSSMEEADVAAGLDRILSDIRGGKSLNQAIADNTAERYTGIKDFEDSFAGDGAAFAKSFLEKAGLGMGALISGDCQEGDLLEDASVGQPLFLLNTGYEEVWNVYPAGYTVMSGGQAYLSGVVGPEHGGGSNPEDDPVWTVTIADAVLAQWMVLNPQQYTADQKAAVDMDGDGQVTVADVLAICKILVGLTP